MLWTHSLVAKSVEAQSLQLFQCLDQSITGTSGNGYCPPQRQTVHYFSLLWHSKPRLRPELSNPTEDTILFAFIKPAWIYLIGSPASTQQCTKLESSQTQLSKKSWAVNYWSSVAIQMLGYIGLSSKSDKTQDDTKFTRIKTVSQKN